MALRVILYFLVKLPSTEEEWLTSGHVDGIVSPSKSMADTRTMFGWKEKNKDQTNSHRMKESGLSLTTAHLTTTVYPSPQKVFSWAKADDSNSVTASTRHQISTSHSNMHRLSILEEKATNWSCRIESTRNLWKKSWKKKLAMASTGYLPVKKMYVLTAFAYKKSLMINSCKRKFS